MAVRDVQSRPQLLERGLQRERRVSTRVPFAALTSIVDAGALIAAGLLTSDGELLAGAYLLATFLCLRASSTRMSRIAPRFSDDAGWLVARMAGPALIAVAIGATGRWDPGFLVPASVGLVLAGRFASSRLHRAARSRGILEERAVIVGAGSIGSEIASTLKSHPEYGLFPVGFVDTGEATNLPLPLLGTVPDLREIVRTLGIRRVIIAFGGTGESDLVRAVRACDRLPVLVHYVPRFFELGSDRGTAADDLRCIPLVPLHPPRLRSAERIMKRAFDLVGATLGILLTTPILVAAALAVRLTSRGPVIFRQERIGRDGRPFLMLKFRTMREHNESETAWGTKTDHVTAVGRFLRKTSIDELPQLANVLRGEMSLVGPRPERPYFVEQFRTSVPGYDDRHRVTGGITGWAQIHGLRGGEQSSIPERARFDNYYIDHWSPWRDLVVILRTFKSVLSGEGEV